jgi:rRNA maturation protein Nop10
MNTNTTTNGTPIPVCPGSGADTFCTWKDTCPVCGRWYTVTTDGKIRKHVNRWDRYRMNMEEAHARTQAFITEMRNTYPAT